MRRFFLLALLLAGACSGRGAEPRESLGELLDRVRERHGAPGAILAVQADGEAEPRIVASGLADREGDRERSARPNARALQGARVLAREPQMMLADALRLRSVHLGLPGEFWPGPHRLPHLP